MTMPECERNIEGRRNRSDNVIIQRIWLRSDEWCHIDVMRIFLFEISQFQGEATLAEFAHNMTPFRYAFNNPLLYIDLHGLFESKEDAEAYSRTLRPRSPIFVNAGVAYL